MRDVALLFLFAAGLTHCSPTKKAETTVVTNGRACAQTTCGANAACTDTATGGVCACNSGFIGNGTVCIVGAGGGSTSSSGSGSGSSSGAGGGSTCATVACATVATCTDHDTGATCACPAGWAGDGKSCDFLAAGGGHGYEIKSDGSLWAWGDAQAQSLGTSDQTAVLAPKKVSAANWETVAASVSHSCGLLKDGTAQCWGDGSYGELGNGANPARQAAPAAVSGTLKFSHIAVGKNFSCAVTTAGGLACWGDGALHQLGLGSDLNQKLVPAAVGTDSDWANVAAGVDHACAIKTSGTLWCWGHRSANWTGAVALLAAPTRMGTKTDWVSIASGFTADCAIDSVGALYCSGGETGFNDGEDFTHGGTDTWRAIQISGSAFCGFKASGALACWGSNVFRQAGPDAPQAVNAPPTSVVSGTWAASAVGGDFTCGSQVSSAGALTRACWGLGYHGRWGDGVGAEVRAPAHIADGFSHLTAGVRTTCALKTGAAAGELACWGDDEAGQIEGDLLSQQTPTAVDGTQAWNTIAVGDNTVCGTHDNGLYCWAGIYGSAPTAITAIAPTTAATWTTQIVAGLDFVCGLESAGVACFGGNGSGQLAQPSATASESTPTLITNGSGIAAFASVKANSRGDFACALSADASALLACWGANNAGQIANGTTDTAYTATAITPANAWSAYSVGAQHACAIRSAAGSDNHTLYCWGDNSYGQLGVGSATQATSGQLVTGTGVPTAWQQVSAGDVHTCAIASDGGLWCWGDNSEGELGRTGVSTVPARVGTDTDWTDVEAGSYYTCALKTDSLYCWGVNDMGQLGNDKAWSAAPKTVL